jgi:hypothetical protein
MVKTDTDVQYHVSLKHPMSVKMSGYSELIGAFDAVFDADSSPVMPAAFEFKTHTLYRSPTHWRGDNVSAQASLAMRVTLHVPCDNIAGIIAQPFKERG